MAINTHTLSSFRTTVKRRINEVAADGEWSTSTLNGHINRSILKAAIDTEQPNSEATVSLRLNVAWYNFPSGVLQPLFFYGPTVWEQARLFPTNLIAMDKAVAGYVTWETSPKGRSSLFIPFSYDKFILWPPPDQNTSVTLSYVPVPTTLSTDGDTTSLHPNSQDLVPIYATYLALRKHDFDKAKVLLGEYKQRLAIVKTEFAKTTAAQPTRMSLAKPFDRAQSSPEFRQYGRRGYY